MKWYRDTTRPRTHAELLLMICDVATFICATLFASGLGSPALLSAGAPDRWLDPLFIAVWCSIPRFAGRLIERLHSVAHWRAFVVALAFLVGVTVLVCVGLEIFWWGISEREQMLPITLVSILCAWGCGFFLSFSNSYRVWDLLIGSTLLLGTLEAYAAPTLWVGATLLLWLGSHATRHLLHNVFPQHGLFRHIPDKLPRHLNVQNAGISALALGLCAFAMFACCYFPLTLWLGVPQSSHRSANLDIANNDQQLDPTIPVVRVRPLADGEVAEVESLTGETITVELASPLQQDSLTVSEDDNRVALCMELIGTSFDSPWRPDGTTLFRSFVLDHYDPQTETWSCSRDAQLREWPISGELSWERTDAIAHTLAVQGVNLSRPTLVSPGRPIGYGPILRTPSDSHYLYYDVGVVQPIPALNPAVLYLVHFLPDEPSFRSIPQGSIPPADASYLQGVEEARHHLATHRTRARGNSPTEDDTRGVSPPAPPQAASSNDAPLDDAPLDDAPLDDVPLDDVPLDHAPLDLDPLIAAAFGSGENTIRGKVKELALWFHREFRYHRRPQDLGLDRALSVLCREQVGNCVHLSTIAALMLRSQGIGTRIVTGYVGADWYPDTSVAIVRTRSAHAWVEVWGGERWHSVDPTEWVEFHPAHQAQDPVVNGATAARKSEPADGLPRPDRPQQGQQPSGNNQNPGSNGLADNSIPFRDDEEYGGTLAPASAPGFSPNGFHRRSILDASERLRQWRSAQFDRYGDALEESRDEPGDGSLKASAEFPDARRIASGGDTPARTGSGGALDSPGEQEDRSRVLLLSSRLLLLIIGAWLALALTRGVFRPDSDRPRERDKGKKADEPHLALVPLGGEFVDSWNAPPSDLRGQVLFLYHQLQRQLQTVRLHRRPQETPHEHATRLSEYEPRAAEWLNALADDVVHSLYGAAGFEGGGVDDDDVHVSVAAQDPVTKNPVTKNLVTNNLVTKATVTRVEKCVQRLRKRLC